MELMEALFTRRSIRKYQKKDVSGDQVQKLLEAAMMAPSAGNQQPWQFIVIRSREALMKVTDIHPYVAMAADAPLGILVCGDVTLEKFKGFWVQDCSAAVQNMLLAAHGLGLGAVWTGIHPLGEREQRFSALFNLPQHVIPFALVLIGHPAQEIKSKNRFKKDRVHLEKW